MSTYYWHTSISLPWLPAYKTTTEQNHNCNILISVKKVWQNMIHSVPRWQPVTVSCSYLTVSKKEGNTEVLQGDWHPLSSKPGQCISYYCFHFSSLFTRQYTFLSVSVHAHESVHVQVFVCSKPLNVSQPPASSTPFPVRVMSPGGGDILALSLSRDRTIQFCSHGDLLIDQTDRDKWRAERKWG